jgi:predicted Rossmann fold nucleotide-binding protein DprA/Smf involved in DNA uptake
LRAAVSGKYREGIRSGQLVLISTYNPEAGFTIGNAMGRNKYVYALADFAVVVSSDYQKGGTWAGADEELRREKGHPVFVRIGATVPKGNAELLRIGAQPFPTEAFGSNLKECLQSVVAARSEIPVAAKPVDPATDETVIAPKAPHVTYPEADAESAAARLVVHEVSATLPPSVYEAVKPVVIGALANPQKIDELVTTLKVRKAQLQDWVKLLVKEGVIEERTINKSKKLAIRKLDEELKLS